GGSGGHATVGLRWVMAGVGPGRARGRTGRTGPASRPVPEEGIGPQGALRLFCQSSRLRFLPIRYWTRVEAVPARTRREPHDAGPNTEVRRKHQDRGLGEDYRARSPVRSGQARHRGTTRGQGASGRDLRPDPGGEPPGADLEAGGYTAGRRETRERSFQSIAGRQLGRLAERTVPQASGGRRGVMTRSSQRGSRRRRPNRLDVWLDSRDTKRIRPARILAARAPILSGPYGQPEAPAY